MSDNMRFVGPLERALYLKTLPILDGLETTSMAALADLGRERRFKKGAVVVTPDKQVTSFHVIVEGSISIVGAQNTRLVSLQQRDAVGFLALLARVETGVEAIAEEDSLTLEFDGDAFGELLDDDLEILLCIVRWLARRTLEERREIPAGAYLAPQNGVTHDPARPIDLVERLLRMRRPGATFAKTSMEGSVELARSMVEARIPAGTTLWSSGERSTNSFMIITGTVRCTTQGTFTPFRCGPGYPLGNLERICDEPRWYTAVAETDLLVIESDHESFFDVIEDHTDMARDFVAAMAGNLIRLLREKLEAAAVPVPE